MKVKQWKIKKWVDDDFSLLADDDEICFNGLWVDDKYWHLYLDGKWIGCLVRRTNQITNYDEHGEELELELREYEGAEYYG